MKYVVYTDGSAHPNPGPGGWAAVIRGGMTQDAYGGVEHATNNAMELFAIKMALQLVPEGAHVHVVADSQYALNCSFVWWRGWSKNNWIKADGKPVQNLQVIKEIAVLQQVRKVSWAWAKGHAGNPLNTLADKLADKGRREARGEIVDLVDSKLTWHEMAKARKRVRAALKKAYPDLSPYVVVPKDVLRVVLTAVYGSDANEDLPEPDLGVGDGQV